MLSCICLVPSGIAIRKVTSCCSFNVRKFLWIEDKIMSPLKQTAITILVFVELAFCFNFSTCLHLGYAPKHKENRWENHSTCLYLKFPIYTTGWIIYTSSLLGGWVKLLDRFELRFNQYEVILLIKLYMVILLTINMSFKSVFIKYTLLRDDPWWSASEKSHYGNILRIQLIVIVDCIAARPSCVLSASSWAWVRIIRNPVCHVFSGKCENLLHVCYC